MRTFTHLLGACLIAFFGPATMLRADDKVIVHEWGTFTCLQDEQGKAIGGINVDDEPVPWFVCQIPGAPVTSHYDGSDHSGAGTFGLPPYGSQTIKGWATGDPAVTMRLETPVLYIYPPKGQAPQSVAPLDVHVDFHGGILSQFYPMATVNGLPMNGAMPYFQGKIAGETTTGLTWKGVQVGASGKLIETEDKTLKDVPWMRGQPVETEDKVWTTPREVGAPLLQVKFSLKEEGVSHDCVQAEHFLFYRGVGHLDSPLVAKSDDWGHVFVNARSAGLDLDCAGAWEVKIDSNETCAYRAFSSFVEYRFQHSLPVVARIDAFSKGDFSAGNLAKLKASMQEALVKEGLYPDEASAMLRTWELSYFKSPGLRFFYIVPRVWVDKVLPLKITGAPTEVTRVMVGRVELITDAQRAALERLVAGPCPDLPAVKKAAQDALQNGKLPKAEVEAFYRGEKPLSELGILIPPLIQDYLNLGRFRDALVMYEFGRRPSLALAKFIKENQIAPPGMEVKGRDMVPLPPDESLKNPRPPSSAGLHL